MNKKLNNLLEYHHTSKEIYQKLDVNSNEIKLACLYFLPDFSLDNNHDLFIKSIFSMYHSLTWKLTHFLHQLHRPTTVCIFKSTIVHNDSNFIEKFHRYCSIEQHLPSTTFFVRITINNYYMMFSYQSIVDRISYVLARHLSNNPIQNISIITIERLIELFLNSNLLG